MVPRARNEAAKFLQAAEVIDLSVVPVSEPAQALIGALLEPVMLAEGRTNKRRSAGQAKLRDALGRVVGGLLRRWGASPARCGHISLSSRVASDRPVPHRVLLGAIDGLVSAGLVGRHLGRMKPPMSWGEAQTWDGQGMATRLWSLPALLDLAQAHGVTPATVSKDFRRHTVFSTRAPIVRQPVALTALKGRGRDRAMPKAALPIDFADPHWAEVRAEVEAVNQAAANHAVTGCVPPRWKRTFTGSIDLGGRWYAQGHVGNYQVLSKADRLAITIDEEPLAEVDVSASHLSIVHGLLGLPMPDPDGSDADLYAIAGIPRQVVKAWVLATLGTGRAIRKWSPRALADTPDLKAWEVKSVADAVLSQHPFLEAPAQAVAGPAGLARMSSLGTPETLLIHRLMAIEARALTFAMRALRGPQGGPVELILPMHDGLLVRQGLAEHAAETLKLAFHGVARVHARVKIDRP